MNSLHSTAVVRSLLSACRELLAELGNKRAADWGIINSALVAGEKFVFRGPNGRCDCTECRDCREAIGG